MRTTKTIKKSIIYLLIFVMALAVTAVSAMADSINGDLPPMNYHQVDVQVNSESADRILKATKGTLPADYNSTTDTDFPTDVTNKNQGSYGNCWAFATSSAADISASMEMGIDTFVRSSPGHFAYFFYNREKGYYPLGYTSGDKNIPKGELWNDIGGNNIFSFQAMANRTGLASESNYPYSRISATTPYNSESSIDLCTVTEDANYMEESDFSSRSEYINTAKEEILKHGAIATSIYWDSNTENKATYKGNTTITHYCTKTSGTNHAITLVGWDDNYPSSNFKTDPKQNGAWILLNSWSPNRYFTGQKNLYYISYADKTLLSDGFVSYNMKQADSDEILFQYDGTAGCYSTTYYNTIANVYTAPENISLNEIGFTHWNNGGFTYDVSVYTGCTNGPVTGTKVIDKQTVSTTRPGYDSFALNKNVIVKKGQKFSIVVSCNNGTCSYGYERSYANGNWLEFVAELASGQSYYKNGSTWYDASSNASRCYRIKGVGTPVYSVTFDNKNVGDPIDTQYVKKNSLVADPNIQTCDGMVLEGWYTDPSFAKETKWYFNTNKVTEDIVLYANWIANDKVNIIYKSEDTTKGTVSNAKDTFDKNTGNPTGSVATPSKYYHFVQWMNDDSQATYDNANLIPPEPDDGWKNGIFSYTAYFRLNQYKVHFDPNGGSGSMNDQTLTCNIDSNLSENRFTRDGYDFVGWSTNKGATSATYDNKASVKNLKENDGDTITLYAVWKEKEVTITYKSGSDRIKVNPASETVKLTETASGSVASKPSNKTWEDGKGFTNWTNSRGQVVSTDTKFVPSKNDSGKNVAETYTANYGYIDYPITYVLNGGEFSGSHITTYQYSGSDISLPTNVVKTGYTFSAWCTNSSLTTTTTKIAKRSKEAKTFYAKWTPNTYSVRFNSNATGVSGSMNNQTLTYDKSETLNANGFTREGYKFIGWSDTKTGEVKYADKTTAVFNLTATKGATIDLYAVWSQKTSFTITYQSANTDMGTVSKAAETVYEDTSSATGSTAQAKTGYHFTKWTASGKSDVTTATIAPTKPAGGWASITYTANFAPNTNTAYKIEYYQQNVTDDNYSKVTADTYSGTGTTGATISTEGKIKEYTGFTYNESASDKTATIAADGSTVLKVYYDRKTFTVNFNANGHGTNPDSQTVRYNGLASDPELSVQYYELVGWFTKNGSDNDWGTEWTFNTNKVTANTTLYAKWQENRVEASSTGYTGKYDGEAHTGIVTVSNPKTGYSIKYGTTSGTYDKTTAPTRTNAGETTVYWQVTNDNYIAKTGSFLIKIEKANVDLTEPKIGSGLTYAGNNVQLITAGSAKGGTIYYAKGNSSTTAPGSGWTTNAATISGGVGEYHLWYRVDADDNHNSINATYLGKATVVNKTYEVTYNKATGESGTFPEKQYKEYGVPLTLATMPEDLAKEAKTTSSGSVNVTIKKNDGSTTQTTKTSYKTIKTTYSPIGWGTSSGTSTKAYDFGDKYNHDATLNLYPAWSSSDQTLYSDVTLPATTLWTRDGYTLKGFDENKDATNPTYKAGDTFKPTGANTLYAIWEPIKYKISFDGNESTSGSMSNLDMTYDVSAKLTANAYARTGYTFEGWNTKADGTGKNYSNEENITTPFTKTDGATVKLFARWTANKYTIAFNGNGSTSGTMQSKEMTYGTSATLTANSFAKSGSDFAGWSDTFDGSVKYADKASVKNLTAENNGTVTLYAVWKRQADITIYYKPSSSDAGSVSNSSDVINPETGTATGSTAQAKAGYHFVNWTNGSGTQVGTSVAYTPNKVSGKYVSDTYTANFQGNTYYVVFDANLGSGTTMNKLAMEYGVAKQLTANKYTREGYQFAGWTTNPDGTGSFYEDAESVKNLTETANANVVLYAKWTANKYTVAFDGNGETSGTMSDMSMIYGTSDNLKKNAFVKSGYTFSGWNTKADKSGTHYADEQSVSNLTSQNNGKVTLYAEWTELGNITISYASSNTDAGTVSNSSDVINPESGNPSGSTATAKTGFHFVNWTNSDNKEVSTDRTFKPSKVSGKYVSNIYTANFDGNSYSIKFSANAASGVTGSMDDMQMKYGVTKTLSINQFAREGYQFTGWNTNDNGTGTAYTNGASVNNLASTSGTVITLYAQWTKEICLHASLTHHAAVKANCQEKGNYEYWECDKCNALFKDANAATETTEIIEPINPDNHKELKQTITTTATVHRHGVATDHCNACNKDVRVNYRYKDGWAYNYVKSMKLKKAKGAITVKFKKQSKKNQKKFSGYQIRYGTSSNINASKLTTAKKKASSKKLKKLKKKTYYYVWMRSYTKTSAGTFYSGWTCKRVKTK